MQPMGLTKDVLEIALSTYDQRMWHLMAGSILPAEFAATLLK